MVGVQQVIVVGPAAAAAAAEAAPAGNHWQSPTTVTATPPACSALGRRHTCWSRSRCNLPRQILRCARWYEFVSTGLQYFRLSLRLCYLIQVLDQRFLISASM